MDLLVELIVDLLVDGGIEIVSSKSISKKIRIPLFIFFIFLFLTIVIGLIILGILLIPESILGSLLIISIGFILFIMLFIKFKKIYQEKIMDIDK